MENTLPFIFVECFLQRSIGLKHSFDLTLIFAQIFKIWTLWWWFQGWMHLKVRPQQGRRSESKECSHKGRTVVSGSQIHSPQYGRGRTWNIQLGVIIYTTRVIQIVLWLAFFKILDRLAWSVLWRKLNWINLVWNGNDYISLSECFSINNLGWLTAFKICTQRASKLPKRDFI